MLLDKGYYDYDYEKPSERTEAALTAAKSDDELEAKLRGMGLNVRPKKKTLTPEELQVEVMGEKKRATRGCVAPFQCSDCLFSLFRRYPFDEVGAGQQRVPNGVSRLAVALVLQGGNDCHRSHNLLIEFFGSYASLVSKELRGGGEVVGAHS